MGFRFDVRKAAEAAAFLLNREPGRAMTRIRLIKLLYLADRRSLELTGRPITGDRVVAMKHGPVLSNTYDCIKGECVHQSVWDAHFVSEGHTIRLVSAPDILSLSRCDCDILEDVYSKYAALDEWAIVDETHNLPEWHDPGNTSVNIPYATILGAVGRGDQAEQILRDASADAAVDRLLEEAEARVQAGQSAGEAKP